MPRHSCNLTGTKCFVLYSRHCQNLWSILAFINMHFLHHVMLYKKIYLINCKDKLHLARNSCPRVKFRSLLLSLSFNVLWNIKLIRMRKSYRKSSASEWLFHVDDGKLEVTFYVSDKFWDRPGRTQQIHSHLINYADIEIFPSWTFSLDVYQDSID